MKKSHILLLAALGVVALVWYGVSEYGRAPMKAEAMSAEITVGANELMAAFLTDETAATSRYADKLLAVTGEVESVEPQGEKTNIHLVTSEMMNRITCEFATGEAPEVQAGATITIKGFCAGYTGFDVLLQRCATVE